MFVLDGSDDPRIYTLDGDEVSISVNGSAGSYISTPNPVTDLELVTVGDYTMVVNKKEIVRMDDEKSTSKTGLLIDIKRGEYGKRYTLKIGGKEYFVQTASRYTSVLSSEDPDSTENSDATDVRRIAYLLCYGYGGDYPDPTVDPEAENKYPGEKLSDSHLGSDYNSILYLSGSTIYLAEDEDLNDYEFDSDGAKDSMVVIRTQTDSISDLPSVAPNNFNVLINGDANEEADDYYMEFYTESGEEGNDSFGQPGLWRESVKPGIETTIDASTMPHAFVRLPTGSFVLTAQDGSYENGDFVVEAWRKRAVGDEVSNPLPSFVDQTINDIGLFADRLYMLSGENVIMSRTANYWDMWYSSIIAGILDDDPIDIASAGNQVNILQYAVPHNRTLVLFSSFAQFRIDGSGVVSANTVSMASTTQFEASLTTKPIPSGNVIYFPITYGQYAGVQEFYTDSEVDTNDARAITDHVKKLINGKVLHMSSTNNYDLLTVISSQASLESRTDDNIIYVYKYLWDGVNRLQSAWGTWELQTGISVIYTFFIDGRFYLITWDSTLSRLYLEVIHLSDIPVGGLEFNTYLDARVVAEDVGTIIYMPYEVTSDELVFIQGEGCPNPGLPISATIDGDEATLSQHMNGGTVIYGFPFKTEFSPTRPFVKDKNGVAITQSKLRLTRYLVNFEDTGFLQATVSGSFYDDTVIKYEGRTIGKQQILDVPGFTDSGSMTVPIRRSLEDTRLSLSTDSYLPMRLRDIEYEGQYTKRGYRI